MEFSRYQELRDRFDTLSADELAAGWHYCPDWDGLLIGPGMEELTYCWCPPQCSAGETRADCAQRIRTRGLVTFLAGLFLTLVVFGGGITGLLALLDYLR